MRVAGLIFSSFFVVHGLDQNALTKQVNLEKGMYNPDNGMLGGASWHSQPFWLINVVKYLSHVQDEEFISQITDCFTKNIDREMGYFITDSIDESLSWASAWVMVWQTLHSQNEQDYIKLKSPISRIHRFIESRKMQTLDGLGFDYVADNNGGKAKAAQNLMLIEVEAQMDAMFFNNIYTPAAEGLWTKFGFDAYLDLVPDQLDMTQTPPSNATELTRPSIYVQARYLLAALSLYDATGKFSYLQSAKNVADKVVVSGSLLISANNGALTDYCEFVDPNRNVRPCDGVDLNAKGLLITAMKELSTRWEAQKYEELYKDFFSAQMTAIQSDGVRDVSGMCGVHWDTVQFGPIQYPMIRSASHDNCLAVFNAQLG